MNIIKKLSLIVALFSFILLTSCLNTGKPVDEADVDYIISAIEKLENGSYSSTQIKEDSLYIKETINGETHSGSQTKTTEVEYMKNDNREYSKYKVDNGSTIEFYAETINDEYQKYEKRQGKWNNVSNNHHASSEYLDLEYYKFLITKDSMTKKDNTYYGKNEEIAKLLLNRITGGRNGEDEKVEVKFFSITIEDGIITHYELEYIFTYEFIEDEMSEIYSIGIKVSTDYSKHNDTTIVSPLA